MQKIIFDGQVKTVFLCLHCGYESQSFEDAKAHDGTCPKHPAVIRAARLEKEADWLAQCAANDGWHGVRVSREFMREQARKAVEESNGSVL